MTELRGFQNNEGRRRLKMLHLPDDIVLCSVKGKKRRLGKAELYSLKDIEKRYNVVVYHLILTERKDLPGTFDDKSEYSYLFVSEKMAEWREDLDKLQLGTVRAILENNKEGIRKSQISFKKATSGDSDEGSLIVNKNLTPAEEEFVKMISFSWAKSNLASKRVFGEDVYRAETDSWDKEDGSLRDHFQSGDIVNAIINELDAGRIVDLSMIVENQEKKKLGGSVCSGHSVNVIGYERAQTDFGENKNAIVFYIYDSNVPHILGTLTTQILHTEDDRSMLIYHYNAPGSKYEAASSGQAASKIVAMDHNLRPLS